MSADTTRLASPKARNVQDSRQAKVAPLLAAGMTVRAISAETGIPVGAVHRAKRQLEKMVAQQAGQKAAAISFELPSGTARPEEIAIAAASPADFDDHVLALAREANIPIASNFRTQRKASSTSCWGVAQENRIGWAPLGASIRISTRVSLNQSGTCRGPATQKSGTVSLNAPRSGRQAGDISLWP